LDTLDVHAKNRMKCLDMTRLRPGHENADKLHLKIVVVKP
jgi:hypothetical protein